MRQKKARKRAAVPSPAVVGATTAEGSLPVVAELTEEATATGQTWSIRI